MTRALPFKACLALALLASPSTATAQDWIFSYTQQTPAAAALTLTDAPEAITCPEHFRPARLSHTQTISDLGTLTFQPNLPRIRNGGASERVERQQSNPTDRLTLTLSVSACVFQRYVLPQSGTVTLAGAFGVGTLDDIAFDITPQTGGQDLHLRYVAHLTDGALPDEILGTLTVAVPSLQQPLTGQDGRIGQATLNALQLDVHILLEDDDAA